MDHQQLAVHAEGAADPVSQPSNAPPSTSDLSEVPTIDGSDVKTAPPENREANVATNSEHQSFIQTEETVKQANTNTTTVSQGWEVAKEQLMKDMATSDKFPVSTTPGDASAVNLDGRGGKRASFAATPSKSEAGASTATPGSTGRGRGRPPGRPRGSRSRGSVGRGRGGKRKREDRDDDEDDDSDSSEVYTPAATQTKSGRAVQKPTSFVPPPATSPPANNKRKRVYRRNPESAVCKMCLRGTSPATNMIVFCDGCNTPYHRYCHHPPIDQAVVDEVEKEWYCKSCERERVIPVADSEVAEFVSVEGVSEEERRKYFAGLAPGMLPTLLVRATNAYPDLPVFAPEFASKFSSNAADVPRQQPLNTQRPPNLHQELPVALPAHATAVPSTVKPTPVSSQTLLASEKDRRDDEDDDAMGESDDIPDEHPARYPRPGQGLMNTLPPDHLDTARLVDEEDRYGVFSHMYQIDANARNKTMEANSGANAEQR